MGFKVIEGGVTAAKGFKAAGAEAQLKYKGRLDMAMIHSERPCIVAGTFTTNVVKAAPVKCLFVEQLFKIRGYLVVIFPVLYFFFQFAEHSHDLKVRAAVFRSFQ